MLQARDDQFCGHGHLAAEVLSRRMGPRKKNNQKKTRWVVSNIVARLLASCDLIKKWVSNMFYFHPYLGKIPILTNIVQLG